MVYCSILWHFLLYLVVSLPPNRYSFTVLNRGQKHSFVIAIVRNYIAFLVTWSALSYCYIISLYNNHHYIKVLLLLHCYNISSLYNISYCSYRIIGLIHISYCFVVNVVLRFVSFPIVPFYCHVIIVPIVYYTALFSLMIGHSALFTMTPSSGLHATQ